MGADKHSGQAGEQTGWSAGGTEQPTPEHEHGTGLWGKSPFWMQAFTLPSRSHCFLAGSVHQGRTQAGSLPGPEMGVTAPDKAPPRRE